MHVLILVLSAFQVCSSFAKSNQQTIKLPEASIRKEMIVKLAADISRVDGEGLIPRANRAVTWDKTISALAQEAEAAQDLYALGRVFRRLDATYPNLHTKVYLAPDLDEWKAKGRVELAITFAPAIIERGKPTEHFVIAEVKNNAFAETGLKPRAGDRIVRINDLPVQKWADENFTFCKFPLREQCDLEFFSNFTGEILSWNRHQPLTFTLMRDGKETTFTVPFDLKPQVPRPDQGPHCGVSDRRYSGFQLKYEGDQLCAFEAKKSPSTVLLRIRSFVYGENSPFQGLKGEIEVFFNNYWRAKAKNTKTLVLDIAGNYGGDAPMPYYAILFPKPFQEQYTQFKKIAEFERKEIFESIFWEDRGKYVWLDNIKKSGVFGATREGDFFEPVPQFCADANKDCREDLFQPRKHGFTGAIKIISDHLCFSSCVGFIYNVVDVLGARVRTFGISDSGDSAYSRLTVAVSATKRNVKTQVLPLKKAKYPDEPEPWVRQVVSASRSTDRQGRILSGRPQKIDVWVPKRWNQSDDEWVATALAAAMNDRK